MAQEFVITSIKNPQPLKDVAYKGDARTYSFDFAPWAEENHTVTSVAWEVVSGQAVVSGAALTGAVATALLTFSQEGGNLIKITATTSVEKYVVYLDVLAKDLLLPTTRDYGVCS